MPVCAFAARVLIVPCAMCFAYCGVGISWQFLEKKLDFISSRNFRLCCVFCFLSNQRNNNKTQTKTHVHIQIAALVQLYNVLYFHSRVGRAGVSKILTKDLSHPTHGVSHPVFCKPIPELKMPDRRWLRPICWRKRLRIFSTRQLSVVQTIFFDVNRMFLFFGAETFSNFQGCFDITCDVECYFTHAYIYIYVIVIYSPWTQLTFMCR